MNKKLILNLISLVTTTFLLVLVIFSWYVSNKEVSATGIMASTAGEDYSLKLQRGKFEYTNGSWKWTWTDTNNMTFSDIQPGDALFFRIVVTSSSTHTFSVNFSQIQSTLVENTLVAYNNKSLVTYSKTTSGAASKYYSGIFSQASVTTGGIVKPYTYYEYDGTITAYKITTDTTFQNGKNYFTGRFIEETTTDFTKNTYYARSAEPTGINAIGYKYDTNSIKYLYPLDNSGSVKVSSTETLYTTSSATVSLDDFLIEDTFKVHSIGSKDSNNVFFTEEFTENDNLYASTYTQTSDTTYNPKKTYYVRQNIPTTGNVSQYVLSMDESFVAGKTYYEKTAIGSEKYTPTLLKAETSRTFSVASSGNSYYYFALEFNEELSLKEIFGEESSNCYLYQALRIGELQVNKQDE